MMWITVLLCMQCQGIGTHLAPRGKSHRFSQVAVGTWGIFSNYDVDGPSKLVFVQRTQDACLVLGDTSGLFSRRGRGTPLEVRMETQWPFPVATGIYGFLSIFKRTQASSPFEALNSAFLSSCQRDVMPPVEMRWASRSFSKVSTGISDISSSCEMKDEPAFKPLQENLAFFKSGISVSIPLDAANSGTL